MYILHELRVFSAAGERTRAHDCLGCTLRAPVVLPNFHSICMELLCMGNELARRLGKLQKQRLLSPAPRARQEEEKKVPAPTLLRAARCRHRIRSSSARRIFSRHGWVEALRKSRMASHGIRKVPYNLYYRRVVCCFASKKTFSWSLCINHILLRYIL